MASSSSTVSVFYTHRFCTAHNEQLFYSYARRRKVIPEVGFNLEDDEYPEIMEQIALRGWRRLAAPRTDISKLLVQEFYANAAVSDEEAAAQEELPYKSFIRGKEIDSSPNNVRRVMRFKRETAGALTYYKTRQVLNQRLDEPLARGWQEFIIHSLVPTGNKSEITTLRAILIHTIMQGEDVRAEEITAENMVTIAQGLGSKGNLAHPSTIYKLCKDAGVLWREFVRTPRIPSLSYITAKRMETISFLDINNHNNKRMKKKMNLCLKRMEAILKKRISNHHNKTSHHNKIISHNNMTLQGIESHLSSMQFFQQTLYENMEKSQPDYMEEVKQIKEKQEQIYNHNQRFHAQVWKEQEKLAKEIQDIRRGQMTQVAANSQRFEAERNLQLALESQGRDIAEIRRHVNLWTNNVSSKEAYACWAQQQANPNLSESDYGASSSSQVDPEEPVPLRTAPPSPHFHPPHPPSN
ncbi:hypothetical protein PIB30_086083 [Stylosanthes scabra]|uniref:Putative plant transposon protein domain-containing protein n=1 Tax=Stylosanthes scabra TaxID=79078 RepID=A0ABU6YTR5_9FABA|nr:hypothetical protein [Stylosanthes scabra]